MLLGLVLGLAIYNRVLLDFPLPLALYKKLLQQVGGKVTTPNPGPRLSRVHCCVFWEGGAPPRR
jgi:ubiquitin-protein ligase E3 A